ncbi:MAG TPA: GAF domain-containing sensor histidine kinase [Ktedonobacterales bacterium]
MGQTLGAAVKLPRLPLRMAWLRGGFWVVLALAMLLVGARLPSYWADLNIPCVQPHCGWQQLDVAFAHMLTRQGLSLSFYATLMVAVDIGFTAGFMLPAVYIVLRRPAEPLALLGALMLVTFGGVSMNGSISPETLTSLGWKELQRALACLGSSSLFTFIYVFPRGRFQNRWIQGAAIIWIVANVIGYAAPLDSPVSAYGSYFSLIVLAALITAVVAHLVRYRTILTLSERLQTKWVVMGLFLAVSGFFAARLATMLTMSPQLVLLHILALLLFPIALLCIPASLSVAILRYRLWDIDLLIQRTLIYSTLTAGVLGLYILVVGYLSGIFQTQSNPVITFMATGIVALLFQPLRERLQHAVNRLVYGQRDDPYSVLVQLGRQLDATLAINTLLPTVAQTIQRTLRIEHVAIFLKDDDDFSCVAACGDPTTAEMRLPLLLQREVIGELVVSQRDVWTAHDRQLLEDLTHHVSTAVQRVRQAVLQQRLTSELQHAREHLVLAREEEHRRLRRDLHDDLAPSVAALAFTTATLERLIPTNSAKAIALTIELRAALRTIVGDIRSLVHDLRPPVLDELGLAAAIDDLIERHQHAEASDMQPLDLSFDAPACLPPLPAAVEVAAYRIVQEALQNIVKHAHASRCSVRLAIEEVEPPALSALIVEVRDNGIGFQASPALAARRTGIGLTTMRERATELGGTWSIESLLGRGTALSARLPFSHKE